MLIMDLEFSISKFEFDLDVFTTTSSKMRSGSHLNENYEAL